MDLRLLSTKGHCYLKKNISDLSANINTKPHSCVFHLFIEDDVLPKRVIARLPDHYSDRVRRYSVPELHLFSYTTFDLTLDPKFHCWPFGSLCTYTSLKYSSPSPDEDVQKERFPSYIAVAWSILTFGLFENQWSVWLRRNECDTAGWNRCCCTRKGTRWQWWMIAVRRWTSGVGRRGARERIRHEW